MGWLVFLLGSLEEFSLEDPPLEELLGEEPLSELGEEELDELGLEDELEPEPLVELLEDDELDVELVLLDACLNGSLIAAP